MTSRADATVSFPSGGRSIEVERFEPQGEGHFPAALLLHGLDGLQFRGADYRAVARTLADHGYVALLLHYFDRTG